MKDAETPQQPELSSEDRERVWKQAEEHDKNLIDTYNWSGDMAQSFFDGAEYATLHERADTESRIPGLEERIKRQVERIKELEAELDAVYKKLNDQSND